MWRGVQRKERLSNALRGQYSGVAARRRGGAAAAAASLGSLHYPRSTASMAEAFEEEELLEEEEEEEDDDDADDGELFEPDAPADAPPGDTDGPPGSGDNVLEIVNDYASSAPPASSAQQKALAALHSGPSANLSSFHSSTSLGAQRPSREGRRRALRRKLRSHGGASAKIRQQEEDVSQQLGEAHRMVSEGRADSALKTLTEIVRAAPNVAQPYFTLSFIHENFFDDKARALGFLEVALSLKPNMPSETERAARLAEELGKEDVALRMYRASIKLDKSLYGALRRMGELYEKQDKPKKTAEAYDAAIARGCNEIQLAYDAANLFFEVSMPERAEQCVSTFMKNSPHDVDLTLHNIHAELLVALKRWKETVNTIDAAINRLCADKSVPYELILKRGQALFHLQETDAARGCFTQLLKVNTAESLGDIIWQSADICYEFKQYDIARDLYMRLHYEVPEHEGPELWNRIELAKTALGGLQEASAFYNHLHDLYPTDTKVNAAFADILAREGDVESAKNLLYNLQIDEMTSENSEDCIRVGEVYRRLGNLHGYVWMLLPAMKQSLAATLGSYRTTRQIAQNAADELKRMTHGVRVASPDEGPLLEGFVGEKYLDTLVHMIRSLCNLNIVDEAESLCQKLLRAGKRIVGSEKCVAAGLLRVENMITRQNRGGAVEASMTTFDQSNPTALLWMVLGNVVWATGKFQELERFCGRMKIMYPKNAHLALLTGHKEMASGAWSQALAEYIVAMKIADCEPMPPLCAAAACLQIAMTDKVEDRHNSILRALTFLDTYKRLRAQHSTQAEGEALFNIGRAFHHLGLVTQACACYKRVVQIPSVQSLQALPEGMVPSVHERASAYNLILLYHQSGQKTLALSVMRAFLSV